MENSLVDFFERFKTKKEYIGVEFEHFITNQKLETLDYFSGAKYILNKLVNNNWEILTDHKGSPLSIKKNKNFITVEPGGQLEISLSKSKNILEIDKKYKSIMKEIKDILKDNHRIIAIGYHPKTKINELDILPKKRYSYMYDYFKSCSKYAHNMMKGTCSTQVIIDYKSEKDFIKKYRVANFLSPIFYRLFDCSPIFEGEINKKNNLRMEIWKHTDNKRCGILKESLDKKDFGFKDYAKYIMNLEPIFIKTDNKIVYTKNKRVKDIENLKFDKNIIDHILGMTFLDNRLKTYIEIRTPDALPYPYNLSIVSIIKNIFYNKENLDYYYDLSLDYNFQDISNLKKELINSYDVQMKDISLDGFVKKLFERVINVSTKEEKKYIDILKEKIEKYDSLSNWLKDIYLKNKKEFKDEISYF
ncbi:MAG: glutamate-cysteine ligase family protein [Bacillota bacterium]